MNIPNGPVAAFTALSGTRFNTAQGMTTYYAFASLPEVVLADTEFLLWRGHEPLNIYCYQSYMSGPSVTGRIRSDGIRMWYGDPEGIHWAYADLAPTDIDAKYPGDPVNGTYCIWDYYDGTQPWPAVWYFPQNPSKSMMVLQTADGNDWAFNPPNGGIYHKESIGSYYSNTDPCYHGAVPRLKMPRLRDPGDRSSDDVLFFQAVEGGNLPDMESIYDLERAFNHPLEIAVTPLSDGSPPKVVAKEKDGLPRRFQPLLLPPVYGGMNSAVADVAPGGSGMGSRKIKTAILLRGVLPGSETVLGTLPVKLVRKDGDAFMVISELAEAITLDVKLPQAAEKVSLNGAEPFAVGKGGLVCGLAITPGENTLIITFVKGRES